MYHKIANRRLNLIALIILCLVIICEACDRSIYIERVDAGYVYITNSSLYKAEFIAEGFDDSGTVFTITPAWEIAPEGAGTVEGGVFRPANNFIGRARIKAACGRIINEYYDENNAKYGLAVRYLFATYKDTASNNSGCRIILPSNLIQPGTDAELSLEVPTLNNDIYYGSILSNSDSVYIDGKIFTGRINILGDIYDITDVDSVINADEITTDSIVITLDIPEQYQKDARSSGKNFFIAQWSFSQLEWRPIGNSLVAEDGGSVNIRTTHFSRYALVWKPSRGKISVSVTPNPFSPYVVPSKDFGVSASNRNLHGTCIEVSGQSDYKFDLNLDIYNVVGDRVWSTVLKGAVSGLTYRVWWDGKTLDHTRNLTNGYSEGDQVISFNIPGNRMCRNGRYFLVVIFKDNKEEKKKMKQIILFK